MMRIEVIIIQKKKKNYEVARILEDGKMKIIMKINERGRTYPYRQKME